MLSIGKLAAGPDADRLLPRRTNAVVPGFPRRPLASCARGAGENRRASIHLDRLATPQPGAQSAVPYRLCCPIRRPGTVARVRLLPVSDLRIKSFVGPGPWHAARERVRATGRAGRPFRERWSVTRRRPCREGGTRLGPTIASISSAPRQSMNSTPLRSRIIPPSCSSACRRASPSCNAVARSTSPVTTTRAASPTLPIAHGRSSGSGTTVDGTLLLAARVQKKSDATACADRTKASA